jgi:two-component system cell cycle sensor histidine kinase/response regulator CckA
MILLVEDEANARQLFTRILSKAGHQVMVAGDGEEALALLKGRGDFELVVTDLAMPKLNGFKLVDQIRAKWPKTKILLMSGYLQEDTARLLLNKGVEFLCKPIDTAELIVRVNHLAPKGH